MLAYFQNQIDKISKGHQVDHSIVKGIVVSTRDEIFPIQVPWNAEGDCHRMQGPNLACNINKVPAWQEEILQFKEILTLYIFEPVEDLGFISNFINLKELYICESICDNWDFLTSINRLTYLFLHDCPNFKTAPLKNLYLKQKEVYDACKSFEEKLDADMLTNIHLIRCGISDLSDFSCFKSIRDFDLSHNNIEDITPLSNVDIYYLCLRWNRIADIACLKHTPYLLNVRHNQITQLPEFDHPGRLGRLLIEHNPIEMIPEHIRKLHLVYTDFE